MKPIHFLILVGICLIWGLHFTVIKVAVSEVSPTFYAALRMMTVAVLLSPMLKWHEGQMGRIAVTGLGFGGLNYVFWFSGIQYIPASLGALVLEAYVPLATILSVIIVKEKIGWPRITGIALAVIGVIIVILSGKDLTPSDKWALGAALVLCGAFSEALGVVTAKTIKGVSSFELLAWFGIFGGSAAVAIMFATGGPQFEIFAGPERWIVLGALAYSVLGASFTGQGAYFWLIQRVDVSQVAGATVMATLFAVVFGVVLLGEPMSLQFIIGAVITLVGVYIIVMRSNRKTEDDITPTPPVEVVPGVTEEQEEAKP